MTSEIRILRSLFSWNSGIFTYKIQIFIHTINDRVIYVGNNVRIPKSYHRFQGVIEKLFQEKSEDLWLITERQSYAVKNALLQVKLLYYKE